MKRKILTLAAAAVTVVGLSAGPAAAHVNDQKAEHASSQADERQGGTPFSGFLGPVEAHIGSEAYVRAHSGMECGALHSPNITPLGADGIGFDLRFVCPANN